MIIIQELSIKQNTFHSDILHRHGLTLSNLYFFTIVNFSFTHTLKIHLFTHININGKSDLFNLEVRTFFFMVFSSTEFLR